MNLVLHEPLGVVAHIFPYNYPIVLLAWQVAAALVKDNDATPFGGMKMSGLGRELGAEGISAFTQGKHVHIEVAPVPSPEWWFPYKRPEIAVEVEESALA